MGEIREQVWDLIRSSSSGTKWDRINSYKMKITIWFSLSSVPLTSYKTYTAFLPSQQMTIKGGWIVFIEYWGKSYFSYLVIGPSRVGLAVCLVMKLSGSLRSAGKESLLLISSCSYKWGVVMIWEISNLVWQLPTPNRLLSELHMGDLGCSNLRWKGLGDE